jgi:hypothetical protein
MAKSDSNPPFEPSQQSRNIAIGSVDRIILTIIPVIAGGALTYAWLSGSVPDAIMGFASLAIVAWIGHNLFAMR